MANESQARSAPEREISVDLSEADAGKAVARRAPRSDIASQVRDDDDRARGGKRSKTEEELFKRMTRMQRSLTKQFDQKLADSQAQHQREIADLRKQYEGGVDVERGGASALKDAHEKAMAALEAELTEANEKGDSAAVAKITAKMIKADGEYHAKLTGTQVRRDAGGDQPGGGTQQPRQAAPVKGPTPAGSRFILANEDWWEDPEHEIEKAAASTIFLKLLNEDGFDANSDETFKEVAKLLKAKFPDLPVMTGKGKQARGNEIDDGPGEGDDDDDDEGRDRDTRNERGRAPAMRVTDRGAGNGRIAQGNRRTLTTEEIKTMRSVGMSPDNDRDVIQFLREAVSMEQSSR
jgi:hypothetical protein